MKNTIVMAMLLSSLGASTLVFALDIDANAKQAHLSPSPKRVRANEQALDTMVAVVNEDVITEAELEKAIETARMQLTQERATIPEEKVLRKQVLDQMINKRVQLQMAKAAGIQVSDTELNKAIAHIANTNNMSVQEMLARIQQDGMSVSQYRSEMREQMVLQRLQQQEVASKVTISQDELSNFIRSHTWQANRTKEYHLQDILVPVVDTPTPQDLAQAKKRADDIITKLKQGGNFDAIAQSSSSGEQALQGGDLGWRQLAEIPTAFSDQVTRLKAHQITGPIQTPNGYHIIRLVDVRTGHGNQPKPDRKVVENLLLQQKFEEAVQNWISKIRSQAYIITNIDT